MNTNSDSSQPSLTGPGGLGGTTSKNGASTNSRVPGAPTIPLDAETHISGPAGSSPNALNIGGDISDIPILVDHARISREDFVVNLSLAARTLLLEQTKKSGQSYLLVGKVTTTTDDWQHISFVDFYDQDRHFQFRNNGVKILVPRELVNRLHNATIELDPITKQYFVKLASPTP